MWLTFAGVEGTAEVWLNGQFLGRREEPQQPFEFEITRLLRDRNELHVEVDGMKNENADWFYPEPKTAATGIKNRVAF